MKKYSAFKNKYFPKYLKNLIITNDNNYTRTTDISNQNQYFLERGVANMIKNVDNPFTNIGLEVNSIKIIHQNIQGLVSKFYGLSDFINLEEPDIICLTEHHFRNEELETITLPEYTLATDFCRFCKGGGVCIYIKKLIFLLSYFY